MEDAAIVDLYWQRSDQAISETDRKYGRYCHTIAYNICASNEDAEECVNDTWFSAWNLMPDKRPSILSTFLGYITRNFALDRYRAKKSKKRGQGETPLALDELEECIPTVISIEQLYEEKELETAVYEFLGEEAVTASQIMEAVEGIASAQKATVIAKRLVEAGMAEQVEVKTKGRKVKGYVRV